MRSRISPNIKFNHVIFSFHEQTAQAPTVPVRALQPPHPIKEMLPMTLDLPQHPGKIAPTTSQRPPRNPVKIPMTQRPTQNQIKAAITRQSPQAPDRRTPLLPSQDRFRTPLQPPLDLDRTPPTPPQTASDAISSSFYNSTI